MRYNDDVFQFHLMIIILLAASKLSFQYVQKLFVTCWILEMYNEEVQLVEPCEAIFHHHEKLESLSYVVEETFKKYKREIK